MNDGLKVFLAVVQYKSFTKAASSLHMTQPAVSQHIRSLEQDLGAALLDRNNRTMNLTRAGEIVLEHARQMVHSEHEMRRLVSELSSNIAGLLHIGASYSIGEYMLPSLLSEFCRINPLVEPQIEIGNTRSVASMVAHQELDVGLVEGTYSPAEVETETLGEDQMVLVANPNHPLFEADEVTGAELAKECWILREEGSGTREVSEQILRMAGIDPNRIITFSSTQAIKEAVRSGLGISVLSIWTVQTELRFGILRQLRFHGLPVARRLFIVTRLSSFRPRVVSEFVRYTREHFAKLEHSHPPEWPGTEQGHR